MVRDLLRRVRAALHQSACDAEVSRLELVHAARLGRRRRRRRGGGGHLGGRGRGRRECVTVGDDHEAEVKLAAQLKQVVRLRTAPVRVLAEAQLAPLHVVVFKQLNLLIVLCERVVAANVAAVAARAQQRRAALHPLRNRASQPPQLRISRSSL